MVDLTIKNIIFDLGGVILDLSVERTLEAFSKLSGLGYVQIKKIFVSEPGFELYEKGLLTDNQFRDFIREAYQVSATDAQIDACWNAMLVGLPLEKIELLTKLMQSHNVILLSNTNAIHLNYINMLVHKVTGKNSLDSFFHKAYYSHLMLMRKPDVEIFEYVLKENNFKPEQTLFLDDNKNNVQGAGTLGINTVHVTSPDLILTYFHE